MFIASSRRSSVFTGVTVILFTVFTMALTDAFVKSASADMTLWQIYVLRSIIAIPVLFLLARGSAWPAAPIWVALRSLTLGLMYLAIYAAIPMLDLSVIAASLYTGPLFIVVLSAIVLGERIAWYQWAGMVVGFVGVLVIVRPATADFSPLSLLPVVAAFLYAVAAVLTRARCPMEEPLTMALWLNAILLALGCIASVAVAWSGTGLAYDYPFLLGRWAEMDAGQWRIIFTLAALIIGVSIGLARAYQSEHPQIIATFDYAYLIFAGFWGFVFFGEVPDRMTLAGMALIVLAGLIQLFAERLVGNVARSFEPCCRRTAE
ncbi:DMT family transporter [Mesorhizobium sp. YR577]|uniref:DMT family transporter n=1 Tax=Mesorhizobium sp. YR577 TaxID=1884373 RepID=UPI0008E2DDCD|nr:DMT family transporter [Mesorhizobium sp. YR577]SFU21817.1 EamA-like transporter family protein [Mesorhizobium sp. YR577]